MGLYTDIENSSVIRNLQSEYQRMDAERKAAAAAGDEEKAGALAGQLNIIHTMANDYRTEQGGYAHEYTNGTSYNVVSRTGAPGNSGDLQSGIINKVVEKSEEFVEKSSPEEVKILGSYNPADYLSVNSGNSEVNISKYAGYALLIFAGIAVLDRLTR